MQAAPRHRLSGLARLAAQLGPRLAFYCVVALIACFSLLRSAARTNEFRDAQVLGSYEEVAAQSVRQHHEWPLWNPYYCGGLYALGNPQTRFAAPTLALSVIFGTERGRALSVFLLLIVGMEGAYRFSFRRSRSVLGAALAAPIFALSGHFTTSYVSGWINFFGFELLPWMLHGLALTLAGRRGGLALFAAASAFVVGFGGTYTAPISALMAGLEVLLALLASRGRGAVTVLHRAALAAWLAAFACAFRLWPIAETLLHTPRVLAGAPRHSPAALLRMAFLDTDVAHGEMSLEGYTFVGATAVLLALIGLVHRRAWTAAALLAVCVWLAGGYWFHPPLFAAVRALPIFESLRYPERFLVPATLYLVELVALGHQALRIRSRRRRSAAWLLAAWVPLTLFAVGAELRVLHRSLRGMWLGGPHLEVAQPFKQARGNRWLAGYFPAQNRGSIDCWEAYPVPMSELLRGDLPAEEYLQDPAAGSVQRAAWSPNRIVLDVEASRPARVLINQNWHSGWRASAGSVVSEQGLLAVDVPEGKHRVTLSFRPRSAQGGLLVTLLAAVAIGVELGSRRRGLRWASRALPLVGLGLAWLGIREQVPSRPAWSNPDGSPVLVATVPADARAIDAEFTLPARLLAVRMPSKLDAAGNASFELYWRVTGDMPKTAAIFVHVETPDGRRLYGDHDVLAGSFLLDAAPRETVLRDALAMQLGRPMPGEYRVYVGLWTTANGKRVPISAPGTGRVDGETRLFVGSFELVD